MKKIKPVKKFIIVYSGTKDAVEDYPSFDTRKEAREYYEKESHYDFYHLYSVRVNPKY